jgi:hypothetical protein
MKHIDQWSISMASCKEPKCCHQASAHAVYIAPADAMVIVVSATNKHKTQLGFS